MMRGSYRFIETVGELVLDALESVIVDGLQMHRASLEIICLSFLVLLLRHNARVEVPKFVSVVRI